MNNSDSLKNNLETWRMLAFLVVIALVFGIYMYRLFTLQIIEGQSYRQQADENRTRTINLPAARGNIYDRNGYVLARNIASYNIVVTPINLPDDDGETQKIFRELSAFIDMPVNQGGVDMQANPYVPCQSNHGIFEISYYGETNNAYSSYKLKCDVSREVAMRVLEKSVDWPGISVEVEPIRDYPTGSLTATLVGYLGPISAEVEEYYSSLGFITDRDKVGYAGLERAFQDMLAGQNGQRVVEVDAAGKTVRDLVAPQEAKPGYNLRLTIDTRLQDAATAILEDEINDWNRYFSDKPDKQMTSGVAIAMNPTTGEILAMVSFPTYENNRMARFIPAYYYRQLEADQRKPLLNHAVGDELPAGSVFKLTTAVGALNEGVITPDRIIDAPGILYIQERFSPNDPGFQREFPDWNAKSGGFGKIDFRHCIAYSSNVCFYKLGGGYGDEVPEGVGICRLGTYARALGYGDYPGTQLPEEANGLVPDPEYKRVQGGESWTLGDTYIVSVGQGYVLATPLQVLMSAATIANDGKLMEPTLLREVVDADGNVVRPFTPIMRWDLTKDAVIEEYEDEMSIQGCELTGEKKTVQPWVFDVIQEGMRLAVLEPQGTLASAEKVGFNQLEAIGVAAAGKTGTAEYCDEFAKKNNPCVPGSWPTHAWTVAYAPYEKPEIAVVAFVYNGGEGASTAAPIVRRIMQAYFELKSIDNVLAAP